MIRSLALLLALLLPAAAQEVDQIVARAIAARGGADRIKGIKTPTPHRPHLHRF